MYNLDYKQALIPQASGLLIAVLDRERDDIINPVPRVLKPFAVAGLDTIKEEIRNNYEVEEVSVDEIKPEFRELLCSVIVFILTSLQSKIKGKNWFQRLLLKTLFSILIRFFKNKIH